MGKQLKVVAGSLACAAVIAASGVALAAGDKPGEKAAAVAVKPAFVAKVNGVEIPQSELDRASKVMLAQVPPGQQLTDDMKKMARDAAVEQLLAAELLFQEGQKLEIKELEKKVAEKVEASKKRAPSKEQYDQFLKDMGMTEKDVESYARKDLIITNLIESRIAAKAAVTEAETKKFYDENQDKFSRPENVKASHILIQVDTKASAEEKKKAKEKIDAILKKIKGGEDFAELAKKESGCPSSAKGGDLGNFGKGMMVPEFEKAAFALKPGEVSEVVETQFGYHIIKLTEKNNAETVPLAEVKPRIEQYLKAQKVQKGIGELVEELRKKAKIELPAS